MKNLYLVLLTTFSVFFGNSIMAQNNLEEVSKLFKNVDVLNIANKLDEKAEVSIMDNDTYTKDDAEVILNDFFIDKSNSDYVAIHKGSSDNNSYYQIGELKSNNETFRTYFYTKEIDGNFLIQELRIERQ